jgi:hypothetical protein
MEEKVGGDWCKYYEDCENRSNVTYVYAIQPNNLSRKIDVTGNYTKLTNISIRVINEEGFPIDNASLSVTSYNRYKDRVNGRSIGIKKKTDINGEFTFTLGGGDLEFIAIKDDLNGKIRDSFEENLQQHYVSIVIK